ncbi:hypothetical protein JCM19235_6912 [Vibrio maritimus]|uniref:HTH lysR-type domain-containing protein n=1 Tax=Vibrio maritimus TaxID=990268 RepID=A0A090RVV2_9VIBR|nr:hypothetical protein JCM19235_6912 [Vibrio maritimus]
MAMTIEQLNAFVETVECGSFKQASARLGKHTSTVSGLIANLEAELGMELFVRKPRSLEITPKAQKFIDMHSLCYESATYSALKRIAC